jgi:CMP/dCMP kinase
LSKPRTIAIDGPAGSGKTTIAELLAARLGYAFVDTGVFYRTVTWQALRAGISPSDVTALTKLARTIVMKILPPAVDDGRKYTVLAGGEDVTWDLRRPEVDRNVSEVSAWPEVREALVPVQRRAVEQGKVIMVGRDIGTVILPEAELKIYLDASLEERVRRRLAELAERGLARPLNEIKQEMLLRDRIDSGRAVAPLSVAPDAHVIDTDDLGIEQTLQKALELVEAADGPN